jgi:HK97 family phage prohead protease
VTTTDHLDDVTSDDRKAKRAEVARNRLAAARAAGFGPGQQQRRGPAAPAGAARSLSFPALNLRAQLVDRAGQKFYQLDGYASVTEHPYEMWDFFGPYEETVAGTAFDACMAGQCEGHAGAPDVAFLVNHRGLSMARTTNGTLELRVDALGLASTSYLNPNRQDVRDLMSAVDDQLIDEMSFAFMLTDGGWNDDYDEFRIDAVCINRGDTSAVNYGANPYTSIAARQQEILDSLEHLEQGAAREALARFPRRGRPAAARRAGSRPSRRWPGAACRSSKRCWT